MSETREADGRTTGREQRCAQCGELKTELVAWREDSSGPRICRHCYVMNLRGDAEANRHIPGYREEALSLAEALDSGEAEAGFDELDSQELEKYLTALAKYEEDSAAALGRSRSGPVRNGDG